MFSEQLRQEAELRFQRQLPYFGQRKAEILCRWVSAVRKNRY